MWLPNRRRFYFFKIIQLVLRFVPSVHSDLYRSEHQCSAFSKFWSVSIEYTRNETSYKFIWRHLSDNEVHLDSGIIRLEAIPLLCQLDGSGIHFDHNYASWRLLNVNDIQDYPFQQLLRDYPDFGSYRLDERLTLNHKLMMNSINMFSNMASVAENSEQLFVVLTIGNEGRDFQVDVYPRNHSKSRVQPTDVLCISNYSLPSRSSATTTASPLVLISMTLTNSTVTVGRPLINTFNSLISDCVENMTATKASIVDMSKAVHPSMLNIFVLQYRFFFFLLSFICLLIIALLVSVLLCLIQRFRALQRNHQQLLSSLHEKVIATKQNGHATKMKEPSTVDSLATKSDATTPLFPKSVPSTSSEQPSMTTQEPKCHLNVAIESHQPQTKCTSSRSKPLRSVFYNKDNDNVSLSILNGSTTDVDVELGAIAARRFQDTLRRKITNTSGQYTKVNCNSTMYSSLHRYHQFESNSEKHFY